MPLLRPANHCQDIFHAMSPAEAKARAKQGASRLKWRLVTETDNRLIYRVGTNWRSWGEVVTIVFETSTVSLASQCRWVTQSFDWGKNRLNCEAFAIGYAARNVSDYRAIT